MDAEEKIKLLEEEIRSIPYHKGTEHHIGRLKARIAKLKDEILQKKVKTSGGGGQNYAIKKSGDATVILVGPPSVGKSTLLNKITNAQSKIAAYDFTTIGVIPGMMDYQGAKIQIFDVPGIIGGAARGKGRGKEVLSVVRTADLIAIMVDVNSLNKVEQIKEEIYNFGIRLDQKKPDVVFKKADSGGVKISTTQKLTSVSLETIKQLASEFKFRNGEIIIKENVTIDRLIDAFMGNRCYLPHLVMVNKGDIFKPRANVLDRKYILISAKSGEGLDFFKKNLWEKLGLICVYLKPGKDEADYNKPLVVKRGKSLKNILDETSIPGKESYTKANIFGSGAKFPGQEVSFSFTPCEGTIISFS